jgi:hypothetical protein
MEVIPGAMNRNVVVADSDDEDASCALDARLDALVVARRNASTTDDMRLCGM